MPWALQHFGDKKVSSFRRKSCARVIGVAALPSSKKPSAISDDAVSDEKPGVRGRLLDGEIPRRVGQLGNSLEHSKGRAAARPSSMK